MKRPDLTPAQQAQWIKITAGCWILFYTVLFPLVLYSAYGFSIVILLAPAVPLILGIIVTVLFAIPALALPVSIYQIRKAYYEERYEEIFFWGVLPFYLGVVCVGLIVVLVRPLMEL